MKKVILLTILSLFAISSTNAQNGGVAVLDIDSVAQELGVEAAVKADLQSMQDNLNVELQKTQANFQAQMNSAEKSAGETPTDEQKRQLVTTNQQLNAEFNRLKAQAQQTLAAERITKINQFREKLKPIAQEAAKAKGLSVVIMKVTPPVFAYTDEVDITADTTKRAIAAGLKEKPRPVAAPAPSTPAPSTPAKGKEKEKAKTK